MSAPQYRHLFFDLDHTIWDFDHNARTTLRFVYDSFVLSAKGINDFETFYDLYDAHNERLWARFRNGFIKRDELRWKRMWLTLLDFKLPDLKLANDMSAAYLEILPTQQALTPNAVQALDYCAGKGYQMHLITNGFETTQYLKLKHSGIAHYFDQVITSERSMAPKPKKEMFDFALKVTGASSADSLMIGDALAVDILGASQAGWDQVYYNPGKNPHAEKPTYEIADLAEIDRIV